MPKLSITTGHGVVFVMQAIVKAGGNPEKALAPIYKIVIKSLLKHRGPEPHSTCVSPWLLHLSGWFPFINQRSAEVALPVDPLSPSRIVGRVECIIFTVHRAVHAFLYSLDHILLWLFVCVPVALLEYELNTSEAPFLHLQNGTTRGKYISSQIKGD